MALNVEEKKNIIKDMGHEEKNTGAPSVQIALLTSKIHKLNEHFKKNIHDFSSKRGLLVTVGKRRRLLRYLSQKDPVGYKEVLEKLGLRK